MRILFLCLAASLGLAGAAGAQGAAQAPPPDCTAAEFHAFDFWIGEWEVTAGGTHAGTNVIEPVLDGCALAEHWTSASGVSGRSLNFYDRSTGLWYQAWTDQRGGVLRMSGGMTEGRMVMQTEPLPAPGGEVIHRITWSREAGGRVRQLWESSRDGGGTWTAAFDGLYSRAE